MLSTTTVLLITSILLTLMSCVGWKRTTSKLTAVCERYNQLETEYTRTYREKSLAVNLVHELQSELDECKNSEQQESSPGNLSALLAKCTSYMIPSRRWDEDTTLAEVAHVQGKQDVLEWLGNQSTKHTVRHIKGD